MSDDAMRRAVEAAMDKLAAALPPEPARAPADDWTPPPSLPRARAGKPAKGLSPHLQPRTADQLLPEHRALIGKYATVDLPDGGGVARLRIYTVTVRRDGRVRAEMRPPEGFTVYRTPDQLRDVSERP